MNDEKVEFVPKDICDELSYRQVWDLEAHYREYRNWLRQQGKDPEKNVGLASTAVRYLFYRTKQFHQWVWESTNRYTTRFTHTQADQYEKALVEDEVQTESGKPYTEDSKRKLQAAVKKYFLWKACTCDSDPWESNVRFSQTEYDQVDYFTLDERERLYEASLTYDDLGKYNDLSPKERDRRKSYLAQKLEKPKSEVTPTDFETCRTSWKIPSLVSVSLDLGARPILIERCRSEWYKSEKGVFQIPKESAGKDESHWESVLSSRSDQLLARWENQRSTIPKYDDSGSLWLNREENPYCSGTLNYLLDNLLEEANIDQSDRKLTWYSIRRSTGTYLTYFRSLAYAKEQLRHKSIQSTLGYVELPVEARRNALNQLSSEDPLNLGSSQTNTISENGTPSLEGFHE